jgi:hypothetical protein
MKNKVPYGVTSPENEGLTYLAVEISYGSHWVNVNDNDRYRINAEATRSQSAQTWRRTVAESPVLGGNYLIHAVPEMVMENISVWPTTTGTCASCSSSLTTGSGGPSTSTGSTGAVNWLTLLATEDMSGPTTTWRC